MAKDKFKDVPVTSNPNYRQFRNTNVYLSRMGDAVRVINGKEKKCLIHRERGECHFYCIDNGKRSKRYLARSIYEAFNGKIPKGYKVMHIDRIQTNNNLNNLKLMSYSEASIYTNTHRVKKMVQDMNTNKIYRNVKECADKLGYCESVIQKVIRGTYPSNNDLKLRYITEDEVFNLDDGCKLYSVYKEGKFMITGTKEECSKFMGWSGNTMGMYMCDSIKNLYKTHKISILEV